MPKPIWFSRTSDDLDELEDELESIDALMPELSDSDDMASHFNRGLVGRRRKAAMTLSLVWAGTIMLHLVSWGFWAVLALTTLMTVHALRVLLARPLSLPKPLPADGEAADYPYVSILVSAKNEEAVIRSLVRDLCSLDYPSDRYDLWVIDDYSTDRTPQLLDQMAREYPQLHVLHRPADAQGGKSGALNQAYALAQGEIIAVFDADAQVPKDLLRRTLPLFQRERVGAVQVRKAVTQAHHQDGSEKNFWIQGQVAEMALDAYFQQQRTAIGGIGELRGNGQFVRRAALDHCGGWNEQTITDDLDLTLRLHLNRWDIDFLVDPAVEEEGVSRAIALWHQRNRWAEGGYQRYLDYWRLIVRNRMGTRKTADLFMFCLTQYILPTAAIPDFLMAIARSSTPLLNPVAGLVISMSLMGMVQGIWRTQIQQQGGRPSAQTVFNTLVQAVRGTLYMVHWFVIVACTTARISVRPKRLKWVKTIHQGSDDGWLEVPEQSQS
jgi:1,2-diacylglycerol 3-beta-glucosyltransferase